MNRIPVSSSNLASVGYDPASQTLEIQFHHGAVYQYRGVPQGVYSNLMNAASKGTYFSANIKNHYPFIKL